MHYFKQVPPRSDNEPYLLIYGRPVTGAANRRPPRKAIQHRILAQQKNRCLYCGLLIGSEVRRRGVTVELQLNWDHFVPYAYAASNSHDNWVAACHVCNGIKSARMFDTVMEAQEFIRIRRADKGYEDPVEALPATSEASAISLVHAPAAELVSLFLEAHPEPQSLTPILNKPDAKPSKLRAALTALLESGHVEVVRRHAAIRYRLVKPYRNEWTWPSQ